jgi:hypothetical protein
MMYKPKAHIWGDDLTNSRNDMADGWEFFKSKLDNYLVLRYEKSIAFKFIGYLKNITKPVKRFINRKKEQELREKLEYWRDNNGLTVITGDTIDPIKSQADGRYYTSKKKYRNELRGRGFDEVGNDTQEHLKKDKIRNDQASDKQLKNDIERTLDGY